MPSRLLSLLFLEEGGKEENVEERARALVSFNLLPTYHRRTIVSDDLSITNGQLKILILELGAYAHYSQYSMKVY